MEIAPESRAFLVALFTKLRKDLGDQVGKGGSGASRELAIFDALLAMLNRPGELRGDEALRGYVAELARLTDESNEYEQVALEHRALAELGAALAAP